MNVLINIDAIVRLGNLFAHDARAEGKTELYFWSLEDQ